jgi:hypothetical protein
MKKIVVLLVTVACLTSALDIHALPVPEATAEPELANEPELTADELEPIVEPEPVVIVLTEADVAHLRTKVVINGVEMWQSITGEIIPVDQPIKITVAERIEEKKMADAAAAVAEREAQRKEMQEARKVEVLLKTAVPVKLEREAIREEFQEDLENTLQQAVYTHKSGFSLQADLRVSFRSHERIKRQYIALQTRRRQEQRLIFELEDEIKALEDKNNLKFSKNQLFIMLALAKCRAAFSLHYRVHWVTLLSILFITALCTVCAKSYFIMLNPCKTVQYFTSCVKKI